MNNSNLPLGCANDQFAPFNQEEKVIVVDLQKEVYTECCGCDNFHYSNNVAICEDCGQECSIYEESNESFNKRLSYAEEAEAIRLDNEKYDQ